MVLWLVCCIMFWVGCSDNGNDGKGENGGGGTGHIGENLHLSGQVWVFYWEAEERVYGQFTETLAISSFGVNGTVADGQLSFTIGTPNSSQLINVSEWIENGYGFWFESITASDNATMMAELRYFDITDNKQLYRSHYWRDSENSQVDQMVSYIYVDRDVSIIGKGKSHNTYWLGNYTTKDFTLNLKKGWNVINGKEEGCEDGTTVLFSEGDVINARWILGEL